MNRSVYIGDDMVKLIEERVSESGKSFNKVIREALDVYFSGVSSANSDQSGSVDLGRLEKKVDSILRGLEKLVMKEGVRTGGGIEQVKMADSGKSDRVKDGVLRGFIDKVKDTDVQLDYEDVKDLEGEGRRIAKDLGIKVDFKSKQFYEVREGRRFVVADW